VATQSGAAGTLRILSNKHSVRLGRNRFPLPIVRVFLKAQYANITAMFNERQRRPRREPALDRLREARCRGCTFTGREGTILRLPDIKTSTGLSRSSIYLRIAQGLFTKPVNLGARAVGWPASEVETLNAASIAGKSNTEVSELVVKLVAARKTVA
jgi:prophage regulatory protein